MGLVGSGVGSSRAWPKGGCSRTGAGWAAATTSLDCAMTVASSASCSETTGSGRFRLIMMRWPHLRQVALLTSLTSLCSGIL